MSPRPHRPPLAPAAVQVFAASDRLNQMLLQHLDPQVWNATPPGNVRSIAAIFTHMHNIRTKWIRLSAPHLMLPSQLSRASATPQEVGDALAESAARCEEMLSAALGEGEIRVDSFRRDGWATAWPPGVEMLCYMLSHEAHHRGQVCMLTHQLGYPLPHALTSALWNWESLWKQAGAPSPPGT